MFVVADGRARLGDIEVGQVSDSAAEIVGGLAAGDVVIMHPSTAVADNVRVVERSGG